MHTKNNEKNIEENNMPECPQCKSKKHVVTINHSGVVLFKPLNQYSCTKCKVDF